MGECTHIYIETDLIFTGHTVLLVQRFWYMWKYRGIIEAIWQFDRNP